MTEKDKLNTKIAQQVQALAQELGIESILVVGKKGDKLEFFFGKGSTPRIHLSVLINLIIYIIEDLDCKNPKIFSLFQEVCDLVNSELEEQDPSTTYS